MHSQLRSISKKTPRQPRKINKTAAKHLCAKNYSTDYEESQEDGRKGMMVEAASGDISIS